MCNIRNIQLQLPLPSLHVQLPTNTLARRLCTRLPSTPHHYLPIPASSCHYWVPYGIYPSCQHWKTVINRSFCQNARWGGCCRAFHLECNKNTGYCLSDSSWSQSLLQHTSPSTSCFCHTQAYICLMFTAILVCHPALHQDVSGNHRAVTSPQEHWLIISKRSTTIPSTFNLDYLHSMLSHYLITHVLFQRMLRFGYVSEIESCHCIAYILHGTCNATPH